LSDSPTADALRIGVFAGDVTGPTALDDLVRGAAEAEADGFAGYWLPWISGHDPLVALALAGARTERIELGTAVVRTYTRHPADLAGAAVSVGAATGGRFTLGIGPSHKPVIERTFGYRFDRPVRNTEEYLEILGGLLDGSTVHLDGDQWTAHTRLAHPDPVPVPVVVAALGPRMLELAGRRAAGTFTWMTGPATLAALTVPTITASAAAAGRPAPRVIVGVPVLVTDDATAGRARAAKTFAVYGRMPSYRAMLDREGWERPEDAAIIGDEDAVRAALDRIAAAGATDLVAVEFDHDPAARRRTRATLTAR
jgi:5,10-methylenetetrahydromethanopterin reductase